MTKSTPVNSERVEQVVQALNALIGVLYAARVSAAIWLGHAERHPIAAKYGLQMTDGTALLMLRKFDDLWRFHIQCLLPKASEGRERGEWITNEIEKRGLRTTANRLIAHYAAETDRLPLSDTEILELIKKNGWETEQELLVWIGRVIWNLVDVRDELRRRYRVMESMDDAWMKSALDLFVQERDTKGGRDEPGDV